MSIRHLLAAGAALTLGLTALIAQPASAVGDGPTLREIAEPAGLLIGSGAVNPDYLDDPQFAEMLAAEFESLSPQNELKWTFVHPEKDVYNFEGLDRLVQFAEDNDMVVKGHGLISGCCNPQYLLDITDPDEFRDAMVEHFTTVMGRYSETMDRWDVVTEMFKTMEPTLLENDFYKVLGPDYIAEAFRIAHEADPDAKLFINENMVEFLPEKRQALYDLVSGLVADGVPIHGVALQMHETYVGPQPGVITEIVDSYQALGLEVSIAELDVHIYDSETQATIYGDVVAEALAAGVTEISTWGFTDKYLWTWLPGAKPLIVDEEYNPKPAYFAYRDALLNFTHDSTQPSVGKLSIAHEGGQRLGDDYTVTMELKKGTPGSYFHLYENDVLVHVQALDARLGSPQIIEVPFTDKAAGTYKYRGDLVNSHGTRETSVTVARVS